MNECGWELFKMCESGTEWMGIHTLILVKNWCKGISVSESGLTLDKN